MIGCSQYLFVNQRLIDCSHARISQQTEWWVVSVCSCTTDWLETDCNKTDEVTLCFVTVVTIKLTKCEGDGIVTAVQTVLGVG